MNPIYFIFLIIINSELIFNLPETNANWRDYRKNKNRNQSTLATSTTILTTTATTTTIPIPSTTIATTKTILSTTNNIILNDTNLLDKNETLNSRSEFEPKIALINETIIIDTNENQTKDEEIKSENQSWSFTSIFDLLSNLFNKQTVIMIAAFLVGILIMISLILLAVCICKSINRLKRNKSTKTPSTQKSVFEVKKKKEPLDFLAESNTSLNLISKKRIYNGDLDDKYESPKSNDQLSETIRLIDFKNENQNNNNNDVNKINDLNNQSLSSDSSVDSIILKTPKTPGQTNQEISPSPRTPSNKKSSFSNLAQKLTNSNRDLSNERSLLISEENETNRTDNPDSSLNKSTNRYTPSLKGKTQQQLNKEQQNAISRRSLLFLNNRTKSESGDDQIVSQLPPIPSLSKRISVTSSTSSIIIQPNQSIDFTQIEDRVDDLIKDAFLNQMTTSSTNNIDNNSDSVNNSMSNIYLKALQEKRENEKLSKSAKISKIKQNKRLSIQLNNSSHLINNDPSGTNLTNNDTTSVNTLESEKSCY